MTDANKVFFKTSKKNLDQSYYIPNHVWTLREWVVERIKTTERYLFMNLVNSDDYSNEDLAFVFVLERKPLYFLVNNIFPTLILNCVTILSYALPFSTQISLCIN